MYRIVLNGNINCNFLAGLTSASGSLSSLLARGREKMVLGVHAAPLVNVLEPF
jgi:hypothetical protein